MKTLIVAETWYGFLLFKISRYVKVEVAYEDFNFWNITTIGKANCKFQMIELKKKTKNMTTRHIMEV
jgi:hypothetical protein